MGKGKPRIVIISGDSDDRAFYKNLLSDYNDIIVEDYDTINQFRASCKGKFYSGIIIDTRTRISASTLNKKFFYSLDEGFPVMQISRNQEDTNNINCIIEGKHTLDQRGKSLLDYFIKNDCLKATPRTVRSTSRKQIFFNVELYLKEKGKPIKTNLWDVSEEGCFILTTEKKSVGEKVWLTVNELTNKTPICSKVKWIKLWGTEPRKLPGFGVSFEQISEDQIAGILEVQGRRGGM